MTPLATEAELARKAQPEAENVFERRESNVRVYCRHFPLVADRGEGARVTDRDGRTWIDFLSGAGSLNYGHNHPVLKAALMGYIERNGIVNSLDLHTTAKAAFLAAFEEHVLEPRGLSYRCQFCGPTGTNAVEAALKLARKATSRRGVVSFTNSFHGMSAGAMAVSSSARFAGERHLAGGIVTFMPFDRFTGQEGELAMMRKMLTTRGSGITEPAAIVLELVQCEGGVNIASREWALEVQSLAREIGAVLIVDEIQTGCGRTGTFFCFEQYGIVPDLVCLSKSLSAHGAPMSLLLIKPSLDLWEPGEHNGTFRGFNYAFVTAEAALRHLWGGEEFPRELAERRRELHRRLDALERAHAGHVLEVRKIGMLAGIKLHRPASAGVLQKKCFQRGLIVETCGPRGDTVKLMPPLTVPADDLARGLDCLEECLGELSDEA